MSHTIGHLSFSLGYKSADAVSKSNLTYNSRSWAHTLRMWGTIIKGSLTSKNTIVWPWLCINLIAVIITVAPLVSPIREWIARIPKSTVEDLEVPTEVLVALGGLMSLLLAFRLNVSYERWWEARCLWGTIISSSRSLLTHMIAVGAPRLDAEDVTAAEGVEAAEDAKHRGRLRQVAGWCIAFAISLKHHLLRSELPNLQCAQERAHHDLDGLDHLLQPQQLRALEMSKHRPLYALGRLRESTEACVRAQGRGSGGSVPLALVTFQMTEIFHVALTGCERILRTPCPPGYVGVLRAVVILWLVLLPICLASQLGSSVAIVPVTMFLSFLVLAIEEIAVEIENPFGFETNDLPLDVFCLTVQADAMRLLDENKQVHPEFGQSGV